MHPCRLCIRDMQGSGVWLDLGCQGVRAVLCLEKIVRDQREQTRSRSVDKSSDIAGQVLAVVIADVC